MNLQAKTRHTGRDVTSVVQFLLSGEKTDQCGCSGQGIYHKPSGKPERYGYEASKTHTSVNVADGVIPQRAVDTVWETSVVEPVKLSEGKT